MTYLYLWYQPLFNDRVHLQRLGETFTVRSLGSERDIPAQVALRGRSMIGKTQSNCGCPNVSNSAQSLGRHGHSFIWGEPFLFLADECEQPPFISLLKGLGSACVRRWEPLQIQGNGRDCLIQSKKGRLPWSMSCDARRCNYRCPSSVEYPPRDPNRL